MFNFQNLLLCGVIVRCLNDYQTNANDDIFCEIHITKTNKIDNSEEKCSVTY